jgi:alpha-L-arabinofuranosidase
MDTPTTPTSMPTSAGGKQIESLFATGSRDEASGDVIVKFVNMRGAPQQVHLVLNGLTSVTAASGTVVTGQPKDVNTAGDPIKVTPRPLEMPAAVSADFTQEFPAYSATVLRFKTR